MDASTPVKKGRTKTKRCFDSWKKQISFGNKEIKKTINWKPPFYGKKSTEKPKVLAKEIGTIWKKKETVKVQFFFQWKNLKNFFSKKVGKKNQRG
jgi:hypothetical protein